MQHSLSHMHTHAHTHTCVHMHSWATSRLGYRQQRSACSSSRSLCKPLSPGRPYLSSFFFCLRECVAGYTREQGAYVLTGAAGLKRAASPPQARGHSRWSARPLQPPCTCWRFLRPGPGGKGLWGAEGEVARPGCAQGCPVTCPVTHRMSI